MHEREFYIRKTEDIRKKIELIRNNEEITMDDLYRRSNTYYTIYSQFISQKANINLITFLNLIEAFNIGFKIKKKTNK